MSTTDPRLLTWLGSPWSRECDICGVVTTDPERTARHKAWHALVDVLIEAFSKSGDDLAEAGRNDTAVVRDGGDGAGKGSTARSLPPLAGADASDVSMEGRSEIGPQKGVQSLADGPRPPESQLGRWIRALNVAPAARDERALLAAFADDIDADYTRVATEHDALTTERDEAREAARVAAEMVKRTRTLATAMGIEREPDSVSVDILPDQRPFQIAMLTAEMNAWRHKAIRRNIALARAERERDEARAEVESLRRAAQVTDASWREHVERAEKAERERDEARADARIWRKHVDDLAPRAEKAEAAVARVRAVVDTRTSLCDTPRDPCPCHDGVDVADVLAALDGVDAGGEA